MRLGFLRPISSRRRCSAWCPSIRRPRDRTISRQRLRWPCRPADPCKPAPALWSDRPSRPARRQQAGRVGFARRKRKARKQRDEASHQRRLSILWQRDRCAVPFLHGCSRGAARPKTTSCANCGHYPHSITLIGAGATLYCQTIAQDLPGDCCIAGFRCALC